jgi:putative transposase
MRKQADQLNRAKHRLPHRDIGGVPVHIVYRLFGSIPRAEIEKLLAERKSIYGGSGRPVRPNDGAAPLPPVPDVPVRPDDGAAPLPPVPDVLVQPDDGAAPLSPAPDVLVRPNDGSAPIPPAPDVSVRPDDGAALLPPVPDVLVRPHPLYPVRPITGRDVRSQSEWTEEKFEGLLHRKSNGPYHLANPRIAKLVLESWHWIAERFNLYIYTICVMSNHVHILLSGKGEETVPVGAIMKAHKNFTAIAANKLLGRTGKSFWAAGYFDRDLRKDQFITLMWYILNNPVNARQVERWEDYPHTYLNPDYDLLFRTAPDVSSG